MISPTDHVFRYQSLVQGQNKELSSLRRQLDQARLSCTRLRTTLDDLQRADYLEQRRLISTARRTLISFCKDELSALRDALSQKDCEIDKLRAEAIQREMHPAVNSSPIKHSHKRKSFFENDGPLTPPLSSGTEESFMPSGSDLRNLREGLNQGRLLSKSIYHKVELGVEDTEEMADEVHDLVQLLDEMSRMLQKMQYKACSQESDNAENIRLRNKVHALEKMLATTVSRMQKNSLLKQGIDHQISSKSLGLTSHFSTASFRIIRIV